MYFRIIILVTWGRGENQMMLVKKVVGNIIALAFVLGHVNAFAASQSVTGSLSIQEIADGDQVTISVTYQATDDSLTTGLGLRLHFDSSKLSDAAVADLLTVDKIGAQFLDDVSDFDNDESTDKFYNSLDENLCEIPENVKIYLMIYNLENPDRDEDEFKRVTIKGAVNIPINSLEKKIDSLPKDKTIVFFCGTGGRAGEAYDMVKMFRSDLKLYFLNAEIKFNKDGSYTMKDL